MSISYWTIIGSIYLILLTIQDYRNGMMIDDRRNWFMFGLTVSLFSHFNHNIFYVILTLALSFTINKIMTKYMENIIGKGDTNAVSWIFLGFAISGIFNLIIFGIVIILAMSVGLGTIEIYKKVKKLRKDYIIPIPFFPLFAISFIFTCLINGLYI